MNEMYQNHWCTVGSFEEVLFGLKTASTRGFPGVLNPRSLHCHIIVPWILFLETSYRVCCKKIAQE